MSLRTGAKVEQKFLLVISSEIRRTWCADPVVRDQEVDSDRPIAGTVKRSVSLMPRLQRPVEAEYDCEPCDGEVAGDNEAAMSQRWGAAGRSSAFFDRGMYGG